MNTERSDWMETEKQALVRELTPDEIAAYDENGWVRLERLVDPDLVASLREQVQARVAAVADEEAAAANAWRDYWFFPGREGEEPFRSLVLGKELGRCAQRLMGREVPVNYHSDLVAVDYPGRATQLPHQDWVTSPFDRVGFLSFYIALGTTTADMGSLRFYSGSHRAGPLGPLGHGPGPSIIDHYPEIAERYPVSAPFDLAPGDASVHTGLVVHAAPENAAEASRVTLIAAYLPADTCYTGAPLGPVYPADLTLEVGKPIVHELFPTIYP